MEFSLFVHMERLHPDQNYADLHSEFIDLALMAEAGGMRTVWTGEHHAMDFTISPNPFLLLTELSQKTSRIRLGTGTIVAPFWHPIRLAGEAAMVDLISGGRLDLGIARGAYQYEYDRLGGGMDAWTAGQHLREMVPAIKGLWAGDYAHDGECWSFPNATAVPKPVQDGGPPVWVAARDPNSMDFALKQRCNIQVTPLWKGDEEVEDAAEKLAEVKAANPDANPKVMLLNHTAVGETEADLQTLTADLSRFYNYFGAWFMNKRTIYDGKIEALSDDELASNDMYAPEKMRAQNVVGRPDEVVERLKSFKALGFDEYSFWIDSGASFEAK
ncbi:MAG: LLM class flavin-dependent oxidoreductase, partial [Pseudomonadota bacterium]